MDRVSKYTPELLGIVRLLVGLLFLEHGISKLFDFPHGPVQPAMGSLIWFQGIIEVVGGVLFAVGFLTRPVAFILAGDMAVAYFMAHASKGFFPMLNGGDAAILYCFIFLIYFVAGPGRWAADGSRGIPARPSFLTICAARGRPSRPSRLCRLGCRSRTRSRRPACYRRRSAR